MSVPKLTPRQKEVLLKLIDAMDIKMIAEQLNLKLKTVYGLVSILQKKIGMTVKQMILNREKILGELV